MILLAGLVLLLTMMVALDRAVTLAGTARNPRTALHATWWALAAGALFVAGTALLAFGNITTP